MKKTILAFAILLAAGATYAESAVVLRSTGLQADAQSDAATLVTLPEHSRVEVLVRKGAWGEVKAANGQRGWVRMSELKTESGIAPADTPVNALNKLLTSGRTANTATVTTGVRGLPREDQQDSRRDADELKRAREFERDKASAQ